jgi:hypothetical protein
VVSDEERIAAAKREAEVLGYPLRVAEGPPGHRFIVFGGDRFLCFEESPFEADVFERGLAALRGALEAGKWPEQGR